MLRCSKFGTGRLVCSKSGLEKAMKFALSGLLTSLSRHLGLLEAKYLSRIGFRNRPVSVFNLGTVQYSTLLYRIITAAGTDC